MGRAFVGALLTGLLALALVPSAGRAAATGQGGLIAYLSFSDQSIHVVKPDGSDDHVVAATAADNAISSTQGNGIAWSPDGTKLAFIETGVDQDGAHGCISVYVLGIDASGQAQGAPRQVSPEYCSSSSGLDFHEAAVFGDAWGPDSKTLAYGLTIEDEYNGGSPRVSGSSAVDLLDTSTGAVRQIGQTQYSYVQPQCSDTNFDFYTSVVWNIAKDQIIGDGETDAPCNPSPTTYASFLNPTSGAQITRWTLPPFSAVSGASPDGTKLIGSENTGTGVVFNASTGSVVFSSDSFLPTSYSPDGSAILGFEASSGSPSAVGIAGPDLASPRTLVSAPPADGGPNPEWGQPALSVWSVTLGGTPVIADREGAAPLTVDASEAQPSPACGEAAADWLNCSMPPTSAPGKDWPMILVRDKQVTIKEVRFRGAGQLPAMGATPMLMVQGKLASGPTISFPTVPLTVDGDELVATKVTSTSSLPATVSADKLTLTYTLVQGAGQSAMGATTEPVYIVGGEPATVDFAPSSGAPDPSGPQYLSVVAMGTEAANGAADPAQIVDKLWAYFAGRHVTRFDLDPVTGSATPGAVLKYWVEGWKLSDFLRGAEACPGSATLALLSAPGSAGVCQSWARLFADALAAQGVSSRVTYVGQGHDFPSFYGGVLPANAARNNEFMLVKHWRFQGKNGSGEFPYVDSFGARRASDGVALTSGQRDFDYVGDANAQGGVQSPKALFPVGNHYVVLYRDQIYDPSYGSGPFPSIADWAAASLDGYATLQTYRGTHLIASGVCVPSPGNLARVCTLSAHEGLGGFSPTVTNWTSSNSAFATGAGSSGARSSDAERLASRRSVPRGTTFSYVAYESSTATITIRRVGKGCRVSSRTACGGRLSHHSRFGTNRIGFSGHFGHRTLAAGGYRATITATDRHRRRSRAKHLTFTVIAS